MVNKSFFPLRSDAKPMIYAYRDHIEEHKGLLKVGYTEIDIDKRVAQQFPTKGPNKSRPYDIVVRESAMYPDGTSFTDHEVHRVLEKKGFTRLNNSEWFKCTPKDVIAAIIAVKSNTLNIENRVNTFKMRPEQEKAVNMTQRYFERESKSNPGHSPKFLWNAKMRFGKTFAN